MAGSEHAEELLMIEEADAWFEYLESTRAQNETRYAEVEPWAWAPPLCNGCAPFVHAAHGFAPAQLPHSLSAA